MSKAIKNIMIRDYKSRVTVGGEAAQDAVLISIRGVKGIDTTKIRNTLAKKNIKITVIRNALAKKTFEGTSLSASLDEFLTGASGWPTAGESVVEVAREIVAAMAKMPGPRTQGRRARRHALQGQGRR